MLLEITYSNWEPWVGPWDWSNFPHLTPRDITYTYKMSLIDSSSYKYESVVYEHEWTRMVKTKNGMYSDFDINSTHLSSLAPTNAVATVPCRVVGTTLLAA